MICKCNKKQYRQVNVRRQAAGCKTSNFFEKYDFVFVLQSTMVTLKEWKMLQKELSIGKKISALLVNSKLANKFVIFNERKTNTRRQSQCSDATLNHNLIINLDQVNTLFGQSNKNLRDEGHIKLFQAPTLLIGCHSQEQVSQIFESIINKNFFLLPSASSMIFPWLHCKLRHLQYNRILLGGIYKTIKYSHLDCYQHNIINSTAYPHFRDSLQKKISLLLRFYFSFFQCKIGSTIPNQSALMSKIAYFLPLMSFM